MKSDDERLLVPVREGGETIIYQTEDGKAKIDVRPNDEMLWLTQEQVRSYSGVSGR